MANLKDDIVAYYTLDEASGDAIDQTSSEFDGSVTGASYGETGKIEDCYGFTTGSSTYVDLGDNLTSSNVKSISAWFKTSYSGSNWLRMVARDNGTVNNMEYRIIVKATTGYLETGFGAHESGAYAVYETDVRDGNWHHVVAVRDGSVTRIYVDGSLRDSITYAGTDTTSSNTYIGAGNNGLTTTTFDGYIDEVGFWDRVLDSDDVSALYNSGDGLAYDNFPENSTQTPSALTLSLSSGSPVYLISTPSGALTLSLSLSLGSPNITVVKPSFTIQNATDIYRGEKWLRTDYPADEYNMAEQVNLIPTGVLGIKSLVSPKERKGL